MVMANFKGGSSRVLGLDWGRRGPSGDLLSAFALLVSSVWPKEPKELKKPLLAPAAWVKDEGCMAVSYIGSHPPRCSLQLTVIAATVGHWSYLATVRVAGHSPPSGRYPGGLDVGGRPDCQALQLSNHNPGLQLRRPDCSLGGPGPRSWNLGPGEKTKNRSGHGTWKAATLGAGTAPHHGAGPVPPVAVAVMPAGKPRLNTPKCMRLSTSIAAVNIAHRGIKVPQASASERKCLQSGSCQGGSGGEIAVLAGRLVTSPPFPVSRFDIKF
ncbi:hypothetical protein G7046_g9547 [Stylonectria norvegica]|nr:hypothetical protein G7046_g9547 [Stylonectria norvegica]